MSEVGGALVILSERGGWNFVTSAKIVDGIIIQGFVENGGWEFDDYPDLHCKITWYCRPDFSQGQHYNDVIWQAQQKYKHEVLNSNV